MSQLFDELYAAGHKPFDLSIERLVALLRVALTLFCLSAFVTTPEWQPQLTPVFELVLVAYTFFGLSTALLPTVGRFRTGWQLPVHLIDIGVISVLMYFLRTLSTTFVILYIFVLLNATFRWNWRGALWTTVALLVLQVILFMTIGAPTQIIIQCAFLSMIGGMFAFFGVSRERSAERLTQIAAWPSTRALSYTDIDDHWLDASLAHIATVLRVSRVLVLWEILQEPYTCIALFADGKCKQDRGNASFFRNLVSEEIEGVTFATEAVRSKKCFTSKRTNCYVDPIVNKYVQDRFDISSVCSAPFSGEICKGRVFMLDRSEWVEDDLPLAEFVASRLRIELEYYALCVRLEETAAGRERIRLARDLHDGVLQSLAAAGLQLKMIASRSDHKVQVEIENVRKLLLSEQQSIRAFVDGRQPSPPQQHLNLHDEIQREIGEIKRHWSCSVILSVTPQDATVPMELIRQIEFLLAEAAANAVRHGKASRINVAIERTPNRVQLRIADNGFGLKSTTGTYSQTELATLGVGPQSICNRITELRGILSLSSSPKGVELCIELPCNDS
jgi:signal transduction histidine kinase